MRRFAESALCYLENYKKTAVASFHFSTRSLIVLLCISEHVQRCFLPGGTPLYRYVRPQRVWFFNRFGHKLGIDFSHIAAIWS